MIYLNLNANILLNTSIVLIIGDIFFIFVLRYDMSTTSSKSSNYVWLAFLLLVVVEIRGDSPEQAVLASGCTRLRLLRILRQSL